MGQAQLSFSKWGVQYWPWSKVRDLTNQNKIKSNQIFRIYLFIKLGSILKSIRVCIQDNNYYNISHY